MAKNKNLLDVEASQDFVDSYKEELAGEFGVFHSVQQTDAMAKDMTKKVRKQKDEDESDDQGC
ncbi:hypothetical protein [Natribacillus halophilus]|uniref:Uncharacterized protein n=1 Tax=Natribacillus halophilus TaxID=549003 RepID=A0A1G8MJQ5_9BACI|nr:hypothetical protein [Natribacillus halophilus]SDI68189.1 hypothetical protein SAMN04488123_104201 [Natribacillus halophilus]